MEIAFNLIGLLANGLAAGQVAQNSDSAAETGLDRMLCGDATACQRCTRLCPWAPVVCYGPMPAGTLLIIAGAWLVLLVLTLLYVFVWSRDEPGDDA